jgi:hypothetical protein
MLPGVSQQQVERWKVAAAQGDAFAQMTAQLQRDAAALPAPAPTPAHEPAPAGV